ncbi:ankyrin repeat-containing protein, putative [Eimeria necatrix]|uniref:Ankyrin repeat-containing protein, putative n=1 Tax=Eimeria necatrix TaxID=51315 RepID=U6N0Q9_9EIME|nr:ankyrin repeat-containing protein, putative [Eimeria necatrix]CDJ68354.1 ankyrin repeat-containing protein, putative [Eimeria necatrix]
MALPALLQAVKAGARELLLQQLLQQPAAAKLANCNGTTALLLAAKLNKEEIVKEILLHGGDPNAAEVAEVGANTALHFAARNSNEEMLSYLLAFGASPNQQNALGQTPLHLAARVGAAAAVQQLLAAGANPAITDQAGFDAACWAQSEMHEEVVQLLPPAKSLGSRDLALFQLLAMDQLGMSLKLPGKKKGKASKK